MKKVTHHRVIDLSSVPLVKSVFNQTPPELISFLLAHVARIKQLVYLELFKFYVKIMKSDILRFFYFGSSRVLERAARLKCLKQVNISPRHFKRELNIPLALNIPTTLHSSAL